MERGDAVVEEGEDLLGVHAAEEVPRPWWLKMGAATRACCERQCLNCNACLAACSTSLGACWTSTSETWNQKREAIRNWWRSVCPLSRRWSLRNRALADCLDNAASIGVMAILTLNIYCATYFLVWAKPDSICLVGKEKDATFSDGFKTRVKIIAIGLPFAACPLTLYIAGQAKALARNRRSLGFVSGMVILEYIYILLIGALMTVCMSGSPYKAVGIVTGFLILLLMVTWGCCCYHPQWLRRCTVWTCCCHEIDMEAANVQQQQ